MPTRLEQLQEFFNEDPHDPFNIYGLALEYQKTDLKKAKELFDSLLKEHESYVPAYYHAANLYIETNRKEEAIIILEKGMAQARQQNQTKALRELQFVYDELI